MNIDAFRASVAADQPPAGLTKPVLALWWARKGDWGRAHATAQSDSTEDGAWVHGYLHRVEGDLDNADYWYGRGGRQRSAAPPDEEWDDIATALLSAGPVKGSQLS